ncbi:MAG: hypothetical protein IIB17_00550 [Chloroflexi bacterium]|nr:hypothetical protein [Chloroflexota bacterium]
MAELEELEINRKVFVSGEVVSEKVIFGERKVFVLNSGIELVCDCFGINIGGEIEVVGVVSEYDGRKQVEVLEIVRIATQS